MIVYPHVKPGDTLLVDGLTHEQEVKERRTSRGKTFDLGGNKFRLRSGIMPVHFHDGKRWDEINLTVTEKNGIVVCDTAGYEVKFDRVVPSLTLEGPQGEGEVALDKVGGKSKVDAASYRVDGNEIVWEYNDYSIHAEVRPAAVEFYKLLKTPAAPRKFEWIIGKEKRNVKFSRKSAGQDKGKRNLQMVTSSDGNRYTEEWTGRVGKIVDAKSRRKSWVAEAEYPILVDTAVSVGVVADADDVTDLGTAISTGAFKADFVSSVALHAGLRFQALNIPKNATITGAAIFVLGRSTINGTAYSGKGAKVKIYGDKAAADAPAWSASSPPSGITKTAGKFTMPAAIETGVVQGFMTDAVQEIVDLAGWTAGNDMRFVWWQNGTVVSFGKWEFSDYPWSGAPIPEPTFIDIFYTTSTPISMPRVRIGH